MTCEKCIKLGYPLQSPGRNICKLVSNFHELYLANEISSSQEDQYIMDFFANEVEPWSRDDEWWNQKFFPLQNESDRDIFVNIRKRFETLRPISTEQLKSPLLTAEPIENVSGGQKRKPKDESANISSDDEESEKEIERSKKMRLWKTHDSSKYGNIELPNVKLDDIYDAFGNEGVVFHDLKSEETCFERLYIKQPTQKSQNCFLAMRLKKQKDQKKESLFDPMEHLMRRAQMDDPIRGLVIYDLSSLFIKGETFFPEAQDEYDELTLLQENVDGLETWVGPNAIDWSKNGSKNGSKNADESDGDSTDPPTDDESLAQIWALERGLSI